MQNPRDSTPKGNRQYVCASVTLPAHRKHESQHHVNGCELGVADCVADAFGTHTTRRRMAAHRKSDRSLDVQDCAAQVSPSRRDFQWQTENTETVPLLDCLMRGQAN